MSEHYWNGEKLDQGSIEWRQARVGLITGSMVGAVLGVSPFASRAACMRRMVSESMGNFDHFSNAAMQWGTDHEAEASRLYAAMYAGVEEVSETGFYSKGDLGASPDRLVGKDGLLEIKCPYAIRNDDVPEFKDLKDVPHYGHQIQLQLYCTDRQWCDFMQWTPHDHKVERVMRDPNWLENNLDAFAQFMEEYTDLLSKSVTGGPADQLVLSSEFEDAVEEYKLAKAEFAGAEARLKTMEGCLKKMLETRKLTHAEREDISITQVTRKGSFKWKAIAESNMSAEKLAAAKSDPDNVGAGSTSWKITLRNV